MLLLSLHPFSQAEYWYFGVKPSNDELQYLFLHFCIFIWRSMPNSCGVLKIQHVRKDGRSITKITKTLLIIDSES